MSQQHFLSLANDLRDRAYGQRLQDVWAWYVAGLSTEGYFVEFGALNGKDFSNSYLLELVGWSGCVAEPHPDYATRIEANRSCFTSTKCVSNVSGTTVGFKAVRGRPALSTMADIDPNDYMEDAGRRDEFVLHEVETISLNDLLTEAMAPPTIDYLSIDTEGSELMILEAFDFDRFLLNSISVEHNFSPLREPLHQLLTAHGFVRVWTELSGHDDWYVQEPLVAALGDHRSIPSVAASLPQSDHQVDRLGVLASMYHDLGLREQATALASELESVSPDSAIARSIRRETDG